MGAAEWPRHSNKAWQEVLDRARALGWPQPHRTTSHPTLILDCPERSPRCRIRAFSTGNGTETVAKEALRKLDRCPHRVIVDELLTVDGHLRTAERLISAAQTLLERGQLDGRIDELLELASDSLDSAENALVDEEFDEAVAERDDLQRKIEDLADDTSPEELLQEASAPLRKARLQLRDLPKRSNEVRSRKQHLVDLTTRRDELSELLHDHR